MSHLEVIVIKSIIFQSHRKFYRREDIAMSLRLRVATVVVLLAAMVGAPVASADPLTTEQIAQAQTKLRQLGFQVGPSDGIAGPLTNRGMCAFEVLKPNMRAHLSVMDSEEFEVLMNSARLPRAKKPEAKYLSISTRCQAMYVVKQHRYDRVVPVSTGQKGFRSDKGTFSVFRATNRWVESNQFSGGMMYRPFTYHGGEAVHGVRYASKVTRYFQSHGCVRTFMREQDRLWRENFQRIGTRIYVF